MSLPVIYARREPTDDSALFEDIKIHQGVSLEEAVKIARHKYKDVQYYSDKECKQLAGRVPYYYSSCPRKTRKVTTLDCVKRQIVWLDDIPEGHLSYMIAEYQDDLIGPDTFFAVFPVARLARLYPWMEPVGTVVADDPEKALRLHFEDGDKKTIKLLKDERHYKLYDVA